MFKSTTQKYYLYLFIGILLLLITTITYAENNELTVEEIETTTPESTVEETSVTNKENLDPNTTETKAETETEKIYPSKNNNLATETVLSNSTQIRLTNLCANISNRLEAVIFRHENIINRLESRINKMDTQNFNTEEAKQHILHSKNNLSTAKKKIENIDSLVHHFITSPTPKADWLPLKDIYLEAGNLLQQSQTELSHAIKSLKYNSSSLPTMTTDDNFEFDFDLTNNEN